MDMNKMQSYLLSLDSNTYASYYNGKMSYTMHGNSWEQYVTSAFPDLKNMQTPENIFKTVIDLYAENLVPIPKELQGFSNILVPLLCRGEAPVVILKDKSVVYPEHYEMISDGKYTVAAIFTRDLEKELDHVTFVYSDGHTDLYSKPIPEDFGPANKEGYEYVESTEGNTLFRFSFDDKGFGASCAALQDRANHSIIDQTVVAEMYARPFWYLLDVSIPPKNPYMDYVAQDSDPIKEHDSDGAAGRIFTTSGKGPFGQLEPPTIQDMIAYHDSIIDKVPQSFGIPAHYFKPGTGAPPTGVALKVLSKRFNNKIARMRDDLQDELERLAEALGVERTVEVEDQTEKEFELWNTSDDLLQEALDAHGLNLATMGYPLKYIAEVVTPGVDLDEYEDDSLGEDVPTPDQVAAYASDPGQQAGQPAINPIPAPGAVTNGR